MAEPEADWKVQERHRLDWGVVGVVLALVVCYLFLGATEDVSLYYGLAVVLMGWLALFFSPYWHPILYLPAVLLVSAVTIIWVLRGTWVRYASLAAILLNVLLLVVTSYLLFAEDPAL